MANHQKRIDSLVKMASCVPKVGSGRLAAAVWMRNDLISLGVNQRKTHPLQKRFCDNPFKEFLHAETDAIAKAVRILGRDNLRGCVLYVARAKEAHGDIQWGMAKSCRGCFSCASSFGMRGIYYTTDSGFDYEECLS